jgi:FecR protein
LTSAEKRQLIKFKGTLISTVRAAAILVSLAVPACWAQAVISAHSGMVNFVEGEVRIADKPVKLDGAIFPEVKLGQTLSTQWGRAEILLTPGVFLRLGRNTSFQMVSNKLTDTQVEVLSGSALVEANEILKDNRIAVKMGDAETVLLKNGLYHFDADAGQVRAFAGRAQVSDDSSSTELKGGRLLLMGSLLTPQKFDKNKSNDELLAWSEQRDLRLGFANVSVARSIGSSSFSNSQWAWDPWMNMYTFLPRSGYGYNSFGIPWYSPGSVWIASTAGGYPGGYSSYNSSSQGSSSSGSSSSSTTVNRPSVVQTGPMGIPSSSIPSGAVARTSAPGR